MITIDARMTQGSMTSRLVLQVHDELVFEVHPGERETLETIVVEEMGSAADLLVPLEVQLGWGSHWDEAAH